MGGGGGDPCHRPVCGLTGKRKTLDVPQAALAAFRRVTKRTARFVKRHMCLFGQLGLRPGLANDRPPAKWPWGRALCILRVTREERRPCDREGGSPAKPREHHGTRLLTSLSSRPDHVEAGLGAGDRVA